MGHVTARVVHLAWIAVWLIGCGERTPTDVRNEPPRTGTPLFIDWSTAVGNGLDAVSDGGAGVVRWCMWDDVLSVVPGNTVAWTRTPSVLAIRSINSCGHVEYENVFPPPADGHEQFWAVRYFAMNGPGQTDTKMHPHTFWPVGAIEAVHLGIATYNLSGGDWVVHPRWTFSGGEFPFGVIPKTSGGAIEHVEAGTWIRYEFILHWRNATEFRWYPRVYDMNGTLLWDQYDFRHTDTNLSLGEWYDASPSNVLTRSRSSSGSDNIRTIAFGMGQAGSSGGYYYIADAAFALVTGTEDFIGVAGGM